MPSTVVCQLFLAWALGESAVVRARVSTTDIQRLNFRDDEVMMKDAARHELRLNAFVDDDANAGA